MSTNELEIKLKISKDAGIHCPTLELAKQVLNIFNDLGLKWCSDVSYIKCTNWDNYENNTVYYPTAGTFSSLQFAQEEGYKIISAEKFIASHTEEFNLETYEPKGDLTGFPKEIIARMLDCQEEQWNKRDVTVFEERASAGCIYKGFDWDRPKEGPHFWFKVIKEKDFNLFFERYPKKDKQDNLQEFNLENYEPKGQLIGFPKEIIALMLEYQVEQGNKKDISIFEKDNSCSLVVGGFDWDKTKENGYFWYEVISNKNFNSFFEKYPKKEDNQEFRVGDKVYDILLKEVGIVQDITHASNIPYGLSIEFKSGVKSYTINGCYIPEYKNPHLLHYRDDYNYDIIDFNNLPQRQEYQRWRAEKGEIYYFIMRDDYNNRLDRVCRNKDNYFCISNEQYKIGNYFQTEEQAQEIVDQMNTYFQKIVKI